MSANGELKTEVCTVGPDPENDRAVQRAAELLRAGQVVAIPTETVYGLAADAGDSEAVERVFAAKDRPADNPLIVHLAGLDQIDMVCRRVPEALGVLAEHFWPGPQTVVVPVNRKYRETVCRGLRTIAVRVPDHPVASAVIRATGRPLAAPSANLSGRPSPTTAAHVLTDLDGRIPLILDGGRCRDGIESTVLDLSGRQPRILRPGLLTAADLSKALGRPISLHDKGASERSPGTRYRHYHPAGMVTLLARDLVLSQLAPWVDTWNDTGTTGYIGTRFSLDVTLHLPIPPEDMPARLYDAFREMDREGVNQIFVDAVPEEGSGISVMDRLRRAADLTLWGTEQP